MAKSKTKKRGRRGIPIAPIIGAVPLTAMMVKQMQRTGIPAADRAGQAANLFIGSMTGVDIAQRKFDPRLLFAGLIPLLGGMAAHKIANRVGFNRQLAAFGSPIRI